MGCRLIVASIAFFFVLSWAGSAFAALPQEAVDAMRAGAELYQEQEYSAAAVEFRKAYEISRNASDGPYAVFLFNAARASHQGGNKRQAYVYYERALEVEGPNALAGEERSRARGYLEGLGVELAAEAAAAEAAEKQPIIKEVRWGTLGWSGAGVSGAGVLLLGAAGGLGISASNQIAGLEGVETLAAYEEERANIEGKQRLGRGILYGGGALVLAGAALMVWELSSVEQREFPRVNITPTQDGVIATWEVRFE